MIITAQMKVRDALKIGPQMLEAFVWLAEEFERLRNPAIRKVMSGRVTVAQAARIAGIPLTEALYLLNLAAGEDEQRLARELQSLAPDAFTEGQVDPPSRPPALWGLHDDEPRVRFVDATTKVALNEDPLPAVMHALKEVRGDGVLLVRHPFNPVPLRDLLAREGFESWAEERGPRHWYIYFYRSNAVAGAAARPLTVAAFVRAVAAGA